MPGVNGKNGASRKARWAGAVLGAFEECRSWASARWNCRGRRRRRMCMCVLVASGGPCVLVRILSVFEL